MQHTEQVIQVAVPTPLYRTFDYLLPKNAQVHTVAQGMRVRIPFGRTTTTGIVMAVSQPSRIDGTRLKRVTKILDDHAVLPDEILELMIWASRYYHHPTGEVIFSALPALLRQGKTAELPGLRYWQLTETGTALATEQLKRAPRQAALHGLLRQHPEGINSAQLTGLEGDWRAAMRTMISKGWVVTEERPAAPEAHTCLGGITAGGPPLNDAQQSAVDTIDAALESFKTFLLEGVTGSGKTEVYFHLIEKVIASGRQALVLVPEIGLTPQLVARFQQRFAVPLAVLHSGLSDRERLHAWLMAGNGSASIIIGTRSAVFTPLKRPGIIIIDEEHDPSFKQQDGFRYHARDIAIIRAQRLERPIVLGTATPSLESFHNAMQGRYQLLELPERAGKACHPVIKLLDVRHKRMEDNLSATLLKSIEQHLANNSQVLLFLNRRGYAPTLLCHDCGWVALCQRCDAHMILHQSRRRLRCHHCDAQRPIDTHCPQCNSTELRPLGHGTERVEEALQAYFPDTAIVRIDRDSTRRKGSMATLMQEVHDGKHQILLGTQMLAKGHHLPNVTLVGVLDADQGLLGIDFRASERMGQLITQVAGRAGRAEKKGEVLIQTHYPEHPLLGALLNHDYHRFAKNLLEERRMALLPPYSSLALLRAESVNEDQPLTFLGEARRQAEQLAIGDIQLLGPVPAPMERRAGRYRTQLLVQASRRSQLHALLDAWLPAIEGLRSAKKVRWSLDVDPMDML